VIPARIICVGNRLVPGDDLGPLVHDILAAGDLPAGVELIDGGLGGLDLLRCLEDEARIILVDQVAGFGVPGEIQELDHAALTAGPAPAYGHATGLEYLLHVLPALRDGTLPELRLVGLEGPASSTQVQQVSHRCLELAVEGAWTR
jgi:hydrogenase maturation protease